MGFLSLPQECSHYMAVLFRFIVICSTWIPSVENLLFAKEYGTCSGLNLALDGSEPKNTASDEYSAADINRAGYLIFLPSVLPSFLLPFYLPSLPPSFLTRFYLGHCTAVNQRYIWNSLCPEKTEAAQMLVSSLLYLRPTFLTNEISMSCQVISE